ncbi:hypothetical protein M409DRAFT_64057 [Zasmidium cellare ATCC 36951]|uniref:FAD-binding domain-containing protein n=1 Tax=Zasmidium cellare ATCC 36951 TaxID=1080233 RepID=A0A6A6CY22_ZASCE|nr:uncharacterized protein M409DRAFT_64057 [Zasmidium cellare ATCC 36951]KAF2171098.1 hypothetical protein M409DRAFT_64057 [Zasmidium cellare ATCC 36951]
MPPLNVIVVGAGIGGLAASVAMRKAGHNVLVLEKDPSKREIGYAISVPPNCSRVLRSLGIDLQRARATQWNGLDYIRADRNRPETLPRRYIKAEDMYGAPHLCCHRVDLHEALREKALDPTVVGGPPVTIREGARVAEFDPERGSVKLQNGEVLYADLIVAADGIRSKAHKWILGEERPAELTKLRSIRFIVATETLLKNPKTKPLIENLHNEGTRAAVWIGQSDKIGIFQSPCRDNTLQNFVIYDIADANQTPSTDWIKKADRKMALELLQREGFDDSVQEIVRCSNEYDFYLWKVGDRDPLPALQSGKLLVLGDAAHPMRPDHGQGASQAVEDAGVLGVMMENASGPEVPGRLRMWEALRRPRVAVAQLCSRAETLSFEMAEENIQKVQALVPPDQLPELTRAELFHSFFKYDCLAEARRFLNEQMKITKSLDDRFWKTVLSETW